jgi:hypothetical protein
VTWRVHGSALHGEPCAACCEAHTNFADESAYLTADNVRILKIFPVVLGLISYRRDFYYYEYNMIVEACCYAEGRIWSDTEKRVSSTYRVITVACQVFRSKRVGWALKHASGISAAIGSHKSVELYLHSHMRLHGVLFSHADRFRVSLYLTWATYC